MNPLRNALVLAAATAGIVTAAHSQAGRTVYTIEVTLPGTKSQGLRGTLYDDRDRPVAEGPEVGTPIGQFHWIECRRLWDSCGWWRVGPRAAMSGYPRQQRPVMRYRILREERRDGAHWRGELEGLPATAAVARRIETPMGGFRWTSGRAGRMHWRGWIPETWPDLPFAGTARRSGG